MELWTVLSRLLVIAGLLLAPIATVPAAGAPADEPMAMAAMMPMPDGMACCPHKAKQSVPKCEKDCPLAAFCLNACFADAPVTETAFLFRSPTLDVVAPRNDAGRAFLDESPPSRPPRS